MRWLIFGFLALSAAGCAGQRSEVVWHKEGAAPGDYQAAAYECERDTRMVAPTFSRGVLIPAIEAQEFATRCMNAKGFYLVTASSVGQPRPAWDTTGKIYPPEEMVLCVFPDRSGSTTTKAKSCLSGGGTIAGPAAT